MHPRHGRKEDIPTLDSPIQVLLVEDMTFVRESITETLKREGHRVVETGTGREALQEFERSSFDLVLLDIVLPDCDGFDLCRKIRSQSTVPIILLTALHHINDVLRGFEAGADDYITKPFSGCELLFRIVSVMRRVRAGDERPARMTIRAGDLSLNIAADAVTVAGRAVELSPMEARLLRYLMDRSGRPVHKEDIFREVWGYDLPGGANLVEAAVRRLRTKIEANPSEPAYILTVHGFGYRFAPEGGSTAAGTGGAR